MLKGTNIIISGKSEVDGVEIARFASNINRERDEISFSTQQLDQEACKTHRDVLRSDRAKFEDFAYTIQDLINRL